MTHQTHPRIQAAHTGSDPALIYQLLSGWVFLCNLQFLRGYCILQSDPVVASINDLTRPKQAQFLCDMVLIGEALLVVTGAYRINYFIAGNSDPSLHAHIVPRYLSEPEDQRKGVPWDHPLAYDESTRFDSERDRNLIQQLASTLRRLSS